MAVFDAYMDAHALDPRVRRRMGFAMAGAVIASALAVTSYATVEKLSVSRVGAPHVDLEFLVATTVVIPTAAPPPPSPEPAAAAAAPDDASPAPTPARDAVEDVLEPPRRAPSSPGPGPAGDGPAGPPGPPGLPGPPRVGVPCFGGDCTPVAAAVPSPRPPPSVAKVPLSVVEQRLRFAPDPPRDALLRTTAGAAGRGGTSVVEFCVGPDGKVDEARTKRSAGDGEIDRICRDTLRRWRFSPLHVQGRATRTCSEMSFVIAFE